MKTLSCLLSHHDMHPHQAIITGPALTYTKQTGGQIVIRSICVRKGCRHMSMEEWVCPIILHKAYGTRRTDV